MKKEKTLELLLWGVVAYAAAVLIFYTLRAFDHGADFISAFGSILSAAATFFAAYVAIALFNDWKKPQRYLNKKQYADNLKILVKDYSASFRPYINALSDIRLEVNETTLDDFNKTSDVLFRNLDNLILLFREADIHFKDNLEPFREMEIYLKDFRYAFTNVLPLNIEDTKRGFMEGKYLKEVQNLSNLYTQLMLNYQNNVLKTINEGLAI